MLVARSALQTAPAHGFVELAGMLLVHDVHLENEFGYTELFRNAGRSGLLSENSPSLIFRNFLSFQAFVHQILEGPSNAFR